MANSEKITEAYNRIQGIQAQLKNISFDLYQLRNETDNKQESDQLHWIARLIDNKDEDFQIINGMLNDILMK